MGFASFLSVTFASLSLVTPFLGNKGKYPS